MYTIVNLSAAIIQVSIYERITTAMCSGANENINEVKLDKKLSPINVWAIAFGCIIGSGAFLLPGTSFLPKAGPLGAAAAMLTGAFAMVIIAINYFKSHFLKVFRNVIFAFLTNFIHDKVSSLKKFFCESDTVHIFSKLLYEF